MRRWKGFQIHPLESPCGGAAAGIYVNWNKLAKVANQIAQGQNNNGYPSHSSRDARINLPAGETVDLGDIYNTAAGMQDITFNFAQAASTPTNGPAYYGAEVDCVGSKPEPGSVSLLAIKAIGMLSRRRRRRGHDQQSLKARDSSEN